MRSVRRGGGGVDRFRGHLKGFGIRVLGSGVSKRLGIFNGYALRRIGRQASYFLLRMIDIPFRVRCVYRRLSTLDPKP